MEQAELHCISGNNDSYRDRLLSMENTFSMSEDLLAIVEVIMFPLPVWRTSDRNLEAQDQPQITCTRDLS